MKRRHVHGGFLTASCASVCLMGWLAWQIHRGEQINNAVDSIVDTSVSDAIPAPPEESEDVRIQLARASHLSQTGENAKAERLFGLLAREAASSDVRLVAEYNLANHYLRQALSSSVEANAVMPLVELAKQRYRDVLKLSPQHWNARYNLEQALRLAPDAGMLGSTDDGDPIKRVDVIVPDFERGDLP